MAASRISRRMGVFLSIFLGWATVCSAEKRSVSVGIITDLTTASSTWGAQTVKGAQLLARDLEAEGKRLQIIVGDTGLSTSKAITEAQKMLFIDKVDALYVEFTPLVMATSNLAVKERTLFVGNCGSSSFLKSNPFAFKTYLDYEAGCAQIARMWQRSGKERIAVLRHDLEFAELCLRGTRSVFPDATDLVFNSGASLFTEVLKLRSLGVEGILNASFERDALNLGAALRQYRWKVQVAGTRNDFSTSVVMSKFPGEFEGALSFGLPPVNAQFLERLEAIDRASLSDRTAAALSYTHLRQIFEAVASCAERDVECQVSTLAASSPDPILEFEGFVDRNARFQPVISEWREGKDHEVMENE